MLTDYNTILWFLIKPSHVMGWGFIIALVLCLYSRKWANFVFIAAAFLFISLGFFPVGYNLVHYWETRKLKPTSLPGSIDGIIVLGGSTDKALSDAHQTYMLNDSADRLTQFAALARRFPDAKLVFTGGLKTLGLANTEAYYARSFFTSIGLPTDNIIFEDQSRNTYENALFSKDLLKPGTGENWLLVTSAFHMPRAMAVFETLEWEVIPYPVDYKTGNEYRFTPLSVSIPRNLQLLDIGAKEAVGILGYQASGRIK